MYYSVKNAAYLQAERKGFMWLTDKATLKSFEKAHITIPLYYLWRSRQLCP